MDDDHFVSAHPVIDKIGITGGRKYANAGNVGLSPEAGIAGEQAARRTNLPYDGRCRVRIMLRNVPVDMSDVGVSTRARTAAS
jgi:hypothetical protein